MKDEAVTEDNIKTGSKYPVGYLVIQMLRRCRRLRLLLPASKYPVGHLVIQICSFLYTPFMKLSRLNTLSGIW